MTMLTAMLALAGMLVITLVVPDGAVPYAGESWQVVAPNLSPYLSVGDDWHILDLAASALLSGYAFAQVQDSTPPTFVSSVLDSDTGVLTITFSETIDLTLATNVVPAKMHIRESGNYTGGGITLSAGELDIAAADGTEISFILNASRLAAVAGLATPELTIEPGAVRDTSGNLIVGTFDVSTKTLVNAISVSDREGNPRGMAFSNDGAKMFVIGVDSGVSEYTLSAPFDASTLTFVDSTPISQEDNPRGIAFSNDGTKMFVIGITGDDVNEYALSTPFDASTRSFVNATSISSQDNVPTGIAFSNDGTKMFVIGNGKDKVNEYVLSAPFDASTLEFVNATSISSQENEPRDIAFSNDGTKMFVMGNKEDKINEYVLFTPFNASTLEFVDATSIRSQETAPAGMAFSSDGAKMFVIGFDEDNVNEYALSSVYPVTVTRTPPTFVSSVLDLDAEVLTITFSETIDAANIVPTKIHIRESGNYAGGTTLSAGELVTDADGATISFILNASRLAAVTGLATPELTIEPGAVRDESGNLIVSTFDASTGKFVDTTPISQETTPLGMAFSSDGTKMFVIGQAGNDVNEYDLFPPFDASTRSFVDATSILEQEDSPTGIAFSSDGTKMFVMGDGVSEYTLSAPFDASTLSFVDTTSASTQETTTRGIAFSSDGTKMFVLGGSIGGDVIEYALSAPFDASTLSFVDATSISKQEIIPRGIAFSSDGAKMFVIGHAGGDVNEYDLSTPFDASTRSFVDATSVSSQQGAPKDIAFSSDGTRMFVIGSLESAVTEYALSSVYPIVVGKAPPGAFTTIWNVASSPHTIRISVNVISGGDLHVDWGDSNTDTFTADSIISHTYLDSGKYQVSMTGDLARINLGNSASTASNLASIDQWGDIKWSSMANAFQGASNMEYRATDAPDLSGVTDMSGMFDGATSFNGDISSWDISSVEDMSFMFYDASSFNHPLDSWDVSAVTDMNNMFLGASSFNHPLDSWDVSAVTDMNSMFENTSSFNHPLDSWDVSAVTRMFFMFFSASSFNHPLDSWDVSAVTSMSNMFVAASSFNHPLDSWDVSAVTSMHSMFAAASSFNHPLDSWNVSAVTSMDSMFEDASSFDRPLDSWDVSSVEDMSLMFSGASSFNHPLDSWDVSAVTSMTSMFSGASSFNQNLGKWYVVPADAAYDVSETSLAVTTISAQNSFLDRHDPTYGIGTGNDFGLFDMTGDILTFKSVPSIGKYEVNVTASGPNVFENDNNWRMFNVTVAGLPAGAFVTTWGVTDDDLVAEISVGGTTGNYAVDWGDRSTTTHTAGATHTYGTAGNYTVIISGDFKRILLNGNQDNAPQLLSIDQWGDIAWSSMANAFRGASNMTYKATDAPDLSGVTDMSGMFADATSFNGDISSWDVSSVEDMSGMFSGAASFDHPLDSWDVSAVTDMNNMFIGAASFDRPLDSWNVSKVTSMNSMFDGAASFDRPLDSWNVSKVTSMNSMFDGAASFDQPLGTWNVSSVTDMLFMLDNAALFRQNLGEWYVVLDDAVISGATETLDIRAQNPFLDGQSTVYGLGTGGDSGRFIVNAATKTLGLDPNGVHYDGTYHVIVTSTGGFGTANHRTVAVTVEGIRSVSVPPTFVSSELDIDAEVLTITFSETIDAANIVPTKIHIRESGNYTHGTTLSTGELDTVADGATISFTLTAPHLAAVAGLTAPRLTIEPGAVRDVSGNLIVDTFDASTRSFVDATSISDQEEAPTGIAFSNDGAKMFVIGTAGKDVNEYTLSTPFDASTRTFVDATSISDQEEAPTGIAFSNDGTKMFVIGIGGDNVNEYTLSTPFVASTRSFVDATSISDQEDNPQGIAFSNDGTKMFVIGSSKDNVNEYTLSTPFVASTLEFVNATRIRAQETAPTGMAFSNDGAKMFVIGTIGKDVNEYTLSTPFDASTMSFADATSISVQEDNPQGIAFSNDGTKMFVIGNIGGDVNEYALSSVYPVTVTRTPPTFVSSVLDLDAEVLTITFSETIDAANIVPTKIHIRESGNYAGGTTLSAGELDTDADGATISFILNASRLATVTGLITPELTIEPGAVRDESGNLIVGTFDASTRKFAGATNISQVEFPQGITFSNDGAKMFVIDSFRDDVIEYALSAPFDASTRSFVDATRIRSEETGPTGMAFSSDGTKMFVIGLSGDDVNEYNLSTPFDASTRSFIDATRIRLQETAPTGMAFSSDGAKMFVIGRDEDNVNEYALSTPFDASTLEFVDATRIRSQENTPTGMAFSSDGTKMFVIGSNKDNVNEYTLSTPFDASTMSFVDATSIRSQENIPTGMAFSSDGAKMFVIGNAGDDVNEYVLRSVYPVTVTGTSTLPAGAFVTTWNVTASPYTVSILVEVHTGGTLTMDWGDGTAAVEVATNGTQSHTYPASGEYQVSMTGDLSRITLGDLDSTSSKLASIDQWGDIEWSSMKNAFTYTTNMKYNASDVPNLSGVSSMENMFNFASKFDGDLSEWNVSAVTDMRKVFAQASSFNGDVSTWNVSAVTYMNSMFDGASVFNGDISSWNVSAVTDMNSMFYTASDFNGDISSWNVSAVTDMRYMFSGASAFNGDISSWNVSAVTDMNRMFLGASAFNGDISSWDVSAVTNMNRMFSGASSFNWPLDSWDVSKVTNMDSMFSSVTDFKQNLGKWYVVPADTDYNAATETTLVVTAIAAQNFVLDGHIPNYGIGTGGNSALFNMTGSNLMFKDTTPSAQVYKVNVTAPGGDFGTNNHRMLDITVEGQDDSTVSAGAFVTTWNVAASPYTISIPVEVRTDGTLTMDWGDGIITPVTTNGTQSHTYPASGEYQVSMTGDLSRIILGNTGSTASKLASIDQWGDIEWSSMEGAFRGASNMEYKAADAPNLSHVTSMQNMFRDASSFNGNLSDWNVSTVTNMDGTFRGASDFNGDVSSWDTSSATDMRNMFQDADNFDGDISGWDVSKVTDTSSMFYSASDFNQPLNGWDVSKVTDMSSMFYDADSFNQPLNGWDVSKVTDMSFMFFGTAIFDGDLTGWNVSKVTDMSSMFYSASSFDRPLDSWDVSKVTDMPRMFYSADSFNQPLNSWNVSAVTDMYAMFRSTAFDGDLTGWNVSKVTDMSFMFSGASSFNWPLDSWDVSKVTDMSRMFSGASSFNWPLDSWDVSKVTDMSFMFSGASSFNWPLDSWDVSKVTNMDSMFSSVTDFKQNLGKWYVVPADTDYNAATETTLVVTAIAAQNFVLDGHIPNYGIGTGGNSALFNMTGSNLMFKDTTPPAQVYKVNVTAPGGDFGTNNHRMLDITVEGQDDSTVSAGAFVTTWNVTASPYTISIPVEVRTDGTLTMDWGDGIITTVITNGTQSHTYPASGEYQVSMTGDLSRIILGNTGSTASKLASIDQWGDIEWSSMEGAFRGASNMEYKAADAPDLSYVTSMQNMFRDASSFIGNLSDWNVSTVTNMDGTFRGASDFNGDVSSWDTSSATDMRNMFQDADNFDGDISGWDVSKVTDMSSMFYRAFDFNQPLNSWNVSKVTDMSFMFSSASSFDRPLDSWDVSKVTDMSFMFSSASIFDWSLDSWDVSSVTDMSSMFYSASLFDWPLDSWDVSSVTDMSSMFYDADSFNQPLNSWNVSAVTDMNRMFYTASDFNGDISSWNVSAVTNMNWMFSGASAFNGDISGWNVSAVTDMNRMFSGASAFNGDISGWNVSAVTDMNRMFSGASAFNGDISGWNVSAVTNMNRMFSGASSFNWPLDSWDVTKVTDMSSMFSGASSFNWPLDSWDVSKVTDMSFMFSGASSFNWPLDSWDVSKVTNMDSMFSSVTDFKQNLGKWYVVPADTDYNAATETTLVVTAIAAQNFVLDGHIPNYGIGTGGNSALFNMTGSNLMFKDTTPPAQVYKVNVTAPGGDFGTNNHRMLDITVEGQDDSTVSAGAFVTTWNVAASPYTISILVEVRTDGTLTMDWGDGTAAVEVATNGTQSHTYPASGEYQVSMTGDLSRIILGNPGSTPSKLASIDQWGDIEWSSMEKAFQYTTNMKYNASDVPNLSGVSSMENMFNFASKFDGDLSEWNVSAVTDMDQVFTRASSFNGDVSTWNVSAVTYMNGMFFGASDFNGDISSWNVSAVTDMNSMFNSASDFNGDISSWNVSAVTGMNRMFFAASDFNGDISSWNVSAVTDMNRMFSGASAFNGDISGWNVSAVTNMNGMFDGVTDFKQNLGKWYVVPADTDYNAATETTLVVTAIAAQNFVLDGHIPNYGIGTGGNSALFNMTGSNLMFKDTTPPAQVYKVNVTAPGGDFGTNNHRMLDITVEGQDDSTVSAGAFVTTWNVAASPYTISIPVEVRTDGTLTMDWGDGIITPVTTNGTQSHTYPASGEYQVSMTGDLSRIILGNPGSTPSKLASIDQWGDIEWSSMEYAFSYTSNMKYNASDVPNLSGVSSMENMFNFASKFDGDLSEWNVSAVTDMHNVFTQASSFNGNVSTWNVSAVTDMNGMFFGASDFNGDISNWNVSAVTDMNGMFSDASDFNGDISNWNVAAVTGMNRMFSGASDFNGDISNWNVAAVTGMNRMFSAASDFNGDISGWDVSSVANMFSMFQHASTFNQPLNDWNVSAVIDMQNMFFGATSFDQNLGNWYVTLDPDTIAGTGIPGVVGTISAQNQPLRDHVPTYVIVDGLDKNHFEIISGNRLNMISGVSGKAEYSVNVTASGGSVFEDGNNWRILNVTVTGGVTNAVPELNSIGSQSVSELQSLTFTATATDANSGDTLTFSLTGTPPTGATITSAGVFTWTPTESQDGDHTITVQVTDGSLTDSETLTVTVNEVNVAPVLNAIGDQTVNELVELTFTATASDTDVVDNLVNTLTFSFDGTFPPGAAITSAGVFTWTPTESQDGDHTITVQVTDGSLTDSETLTVTVNEVNVAPVLNTIGDQTVNEFVELTFTATASDDDSLTFLLDGTFPSGAAITSAGVFTWTPTESQDGDHTITVQVTDGSLTDSETLTVTVNEVNVAPVLNTIGDQTVNELVELTFTATASDTDVVDNLVNTLTFSFDGTFPPGAAITSAGVFTWTPTELQVGSHDITVQVTDGSLTDSETLTVTVNEVNVAPVLNTIGDQTVNEFVELTFTATASDDDSLTFLLDGTFPSGAAITSAGVFTWTPTESQDGDHTITVQVTDGSLTDSETLTVTVNEVNVAPVLNAIGDQTVNELVELTFTATASDTDVVDNLVNTLTFSFDGTFPPGAAITSAGVFTWTPTESQDGDHTITVQVTDGSLTDSETLTVTVNETPHGSPPHSLTSTSGVNWIVLNWEEPVTGFDEGIYQVEYGIYTSKSVSGNFVKCNDIGLDYTFNVGDATTVPFYLGNGTVIPPGTIVTDGLDIGTCLVDSTHPLRLYTGTGVVSIPGFAHLTDIVAPITKYNVTLSDAPNVGEVLPYRIVIKDTDLYSNVLYAQGLRDFPDQIPETTPEPEVLATSIPDTRFESANPKLEYDALHSADTVIDLTYNQNGSPVPLSHITGNFTVASIVTQTTTARGNVVSTDVMNPYRWTPDTLQYNGFNCATITGLESDGIISEILYTPPVGFFGPDYFEVLLEEVNPGVQQIGNVRYCEGTGVTKTITVTINVDTRPNIIAPPQKTISADADGDFSVTSTELLEDVTVDDSQYEEFLTIDVVGDLNLQTNTLDTRDGSTITQTDDSGIYTYSGTVIGDDSMDVDYKLDAPYTEYSGNSVTITRSEITSILSTLVNIVDTTIPVITLTGENPQTIELGDVYIELGATTDDGSDVIIDTSAFRGDTVGTYQILYDSVDSVGNHAVQVTRTVNVVDSTIPVITLTGENPQTIELGDGYIELGATTDDGSAVAINDLAFANAVGTYLIYYDSVDSEGNHAVQVTRTVNVVDTTIPVITLTGDNPQTIELGDVYIELGATTDDGSDVTINISAFRNTVGTYLILYDSVDSEGNSAVQVTRTVNVVDSTIPVITLTGENPQTIELGDVYIELGATTDDGSDVTIDISAFRNTVGTYLILYDSVDSEGNSAVQVTRTVNVVDSTIPVITLTGENPQIIELGDVYIELGATTDDGSDVTIDTSAFRNTVGTYQILYDSVDSEGNSAVQVTRTVNVVDSTIPVITLTGENPQTIELGDVYTDLGATTDDGSDVTIDTSAFRNTVGTYLILYDSVDSEGNSAVQVTRTVNVVDTTIPVITLTGENPQIIELGDVYTDLGATTDDGSDVTIDTSAFRNTVGTYLILYDSVDSEGNSAVQVTRTVNVVDTTIPVITLTGENPQTIELGDVYIDLGATTDDGSDVTIDTSAFRNTVGTYLILYDSVDSEGNHAVQVTRTVNVVDTTIPDTTPPVITLTGDNPQTIELGDVYIELGATTDDGSDVTINISAFRNTVGTYLILYDSVDSEGNSAVQVTRTVNVVDSTIPVITLTGENPQTIELGDVYIELGATTDDGSDVTIDISAFRNTVGTYLILYDSVDSEGNSAVQVTRTVNVVDSTIPVITLTGENPQIIELGDVYIELGATTDDGSDVTIDTSAFRNTVGTYQILYDSVDSEGNSAVQVTRTVNVVDSTIPVITLTGENPQTIELGDVYIELGATTDDGSDVTIDTSAFRNTVGTYLILYDSVDSEGNSAVQVTRTVNVVDTTIPDTTPPVITLTGENPQIIELGDGYTDLGATTDDGSDVTIDTSAFRNTVGTYLILYDSVDSEGNSAVQVTRTVNVVDTTPPVITLTGDNPQTIELGDGYTELSATTDDDSDITIDDLAFRDTVGTYLIYYDSTDSEGNSAVQVTRTVNVVDTTRLIVDVTAPDDITKASDQRYIYIDVGMADATGSHPPFKIFKNSGYDTYPIGETIVTWYAVDSEGNYATDTQTITVTDNRGPPKMSQPSRYSAEATGIMTPLDSTDYGVPRVYYTGELDLVAITDAPSEFPLGVTIINWTVTNSGGLSTTVSQQIYLKDTTAPTITAPPDMTFAIVDYIGTHGGSFVFSPNGGSGYIRLSEADYGLPTAYDAVGPVTISNDLSSSAFHIGENVITWTAVDGKQQVAYDTQTITIVYSLSTPDQDPVVDEPVVDEPVVDEPVVDEPVVDEPVVDEPVVDEPVVDEPVVDEPVVDEPVVDEPGQGSSTEIDTTLTKVTGHEFELYVGGSYSDINTVIRLAISLDGETISSSDVPLAADLYVIQNDNILYHEYSSYITSKNYLEFSQTQDDFKLDLSEATVRFQFHSDHDSFDNKYIEITMSSDETSFFRDAPVITLIGDDTQTIIVDEEYVELGATVSDESLLDINDFDLQNNIPGSYTIYYNAANHNKSAETVTRTVNVIAAGESSDGTIAQTASKFVNLTYTYANGDPVEVTPAVTFNSESDVAGTFEIIITDNTSSANSITHPFISDGSGRNDRDTVSFDLITDHTYSIELSDGDNLDYEITCYVGTTNVNPADAFVATSGLDLSCSVFVYGFLDENDEPVVDEPVVDEPVVDEPVVDEPVVDEPVVEDTEPIVPAHLGFVDNFAMDDYITGETVTLQTYVKSGDPNVIVTYSIRPFNDNIDLITSDDTRTLSFVVPVYTDKVTETLEVTAAGESSDGTIAQTASKFVNLTYTYANGDPVEVTPAVTFYSESDVAGTFEIIITDNTSSANSITHPFISDGSGRNDRDTVSFDLITDHTYSIELSDGDNLDYEITCYVGTTNVNPADAFVATSGLDLSCSVFVYGFLDENDESVVEDDSPVTPIVAGDSTTPTKKSGGDLGDKHNTHPTFGNSWDTFRNLVDCGYSMDGICTEVDSYHVDYTRQTINTGTTHDFTLKTYAQNGLKSFTLGFGVDEVGAPVSESEAAITANLSRDYSLDSTYVIDSVDYINNDNVIGENATFDISLVTCSVGNSVECVQLDINGLLFREIMYDDPFLIEAIDTKRYVTTHYMNEGLQIVGDSLNPAPVETLKKKVNAQSVMLDIQLVRTDKLADIWTDQFGHKWSKHNPGNWYYVDGPVLDNTSACDDIDKRVCDAFIAKLGWHTDNMELLRDSIYGNIYTVEEFDDLHDAITIFDMDGDSRTKFLIENDMMWIRN